MKNAFENKKRKIQFKFVAIKIDWLKNWFKKMCDFILILYTISTKTCAKNN